MRTVASLNTLNNSFFRRRYRDTFMALLHFKFVLHTLALPEDEAAPEALPEEELEEFLLKLLQGISNFGKRELRFLTALSENASLRAWRLSELMPILETFDETSNLAHQVDYPLRAKHLWAGIRETYIQLKANVVRLHIFG